MDVRSEEAEVTSGFGERGKGGSQAEEGKTYGDPYGLYRRWFEAWGEGGSKTSVGAEEIEELWRRWFAGTAKGLGGPSGGGSAGGLGALWEQMAESMRKEATSSGQLPADPVEFFLRWYGKTNEKWAEIADDLLKKQEFLKSNAQVQEDFARSHQKLRQASEENLKNLQMPSRSDVARVAKLVVGVENKVDRIEEAFGEFVYGGAEPATAESVRGLQERMDALEAKVDRILRVLEKDAG